VIRYNEARAFRGNAITGVDEDMVLGWFSKNDWTSYDLESYEQEFIPVGGMVGDDIASGLETVPGIYYFEAYIEYDEDDDDYDEHKDVDFSFKVIE